MNLSTLYKKLTNGKYIIGYKFIISLFMGVIFLLNFSSAGTVTYNGYVYSTNSIYIPSPVEQTSCDITLVCTFGNTKYIDGVPSIVYVNSSHQYKSQTLSNFSLSSSRHQISFDFSSISNCDHILFFNSSITYNPDDNVTLSCVYSGAGILTVPGGTCPECPSCPEINTGGILSGYILESEIDTNYCVGNGLCPNECGSGEDLTGINRSTLYINNIQYPGAPTIKFTIPEEIQRENNTDEEEVNIDVIGYGYDQDKMQQMVNTQYYKPTAEEMSGLIEKVADFLPLIAVALLIIRIRRIIKKVYFKF